MVPSPLLKAVVLGALLLRSADPGIRTSFNVEVCAFNATHIVVATEGAKIDGVLDILESWKGDLLKGDRIRIPELARLASDEARTVFDDKNKKVSGARMILYLMKTPFLAGPAPTQERQRWDTANQGGGMNVSAAWIEGDQAYAFVQVMNPGAAVLVSYCNEKELKTHTLRAMEVRADVEKALAIPEAAQRDKALSSFTNSDIHPAKNLLGSYDELIGSLRLVDEKGGLTPNWSLRNYSFWCQCPILIPHFGGMGRKATALLADSVLNSVNTERYGAALINAIGRAESGTARPFLLAILEKQLAYWKAENPKLKAGWADAFETDEERDWQAVNRRYRTWMLLELLEALDRMKTPESQMAVSAFREFWRATPLLAQELPQISR